MRKFLWTLLKVLFIIVLIVAVSGGVFYLVSLKEWPWWIGAAILSGIAGIVGLIYLIRVYVLRHRERAFVNRVVEYDNSLIESAKEENRLRQLQLQERWLEGVNTLRESRLKNLGNPLYVLPWFVVFGETDSGKSSAIYRSGLTSILSGVGPVHGARHTQNCDWWFFEEAIIIDTAGRYAVPLTEKSDDEEWSEFLALLLKYRKKEPLNGLVITLPVEKLLDNNEQALRDYGRHIGGRINRVMRIMGARIPVYLMVTKADMIYGFCDFAAQLSPDDLKQAFGYTAENTDDITGFVDKAVADIITKVDNHLLVLDDIKGGERFLLSSELLALKASLNTFINSAFSSGKYHEAVLLKGLYFSSAVQPGEEKSQFIGELLPDVEGVEIQDENKGSGLFLYDFFSSVLPTHRNVFKPIKEFLRWKTISANIALVTFLLLTFCFVAIASLNFSKDHELMAQLQAQVQASKTPKTVVLDDILALGTLRSTITDVEEAYKNWPIPQFGLDWALKRSIKESKAFLVKRFADSVLPSTDKILYSHLKHVETEKSSPIVGDTIVHLAWRLKEIEEKLNQIPHEKEGLGYQEWMTLDKRLLGIEISYQATFALLYDAYVSWQTDTETLQYLASTTRSALSDVVLNRKDWNWITTWAGSSHNSVAVKAADFWSQTFKSNSTLSGAYTKDGYNSIQKLIRILKTTSNDKTVEIQINRFWSLYGAEYVQQWQRFARQFNISTKGLTLEDKRLIMQRMAGKDNPYMLMQKKMLEELQAIQPIYSVNLDDLILSQAIIKDYWEKKENESKDIKKGVNAIIGAVSNISDPVYFKKVNDGILAYQQFQKGLSDIVPDVSTINASFNSASKILSNSDPKSPITQTMMAADSLDLILEDKDTQFDAGDIYRNSVQFVLSAEMELAACALQNYWESDVYGALKYIPADEQESRLFTKGGLLSKFIDGPAKGFVERRADGWHPKSFQGLSIPFKTDFFQFVERGAYLEQKVKSSYNVTVANVPMSINGSAALKPKSVTLKLQCASGEISLDNYNFPASQLFKWDPSNCGTTTLDVKFDGLNVTKTYSGQLGFQKFLTDFRTGQRTFKPSDFPAHEKELTQMGMKWLTLSYKINGGVPIIALAKSNSLSVPLTIAECSVDSVR
ncbi:type VI secretion protein IcmF/TssM N-terminal domain-containing protein [uncultured Shewanella sp.]|uniref:type VI secretion protein IcmF/TssM N-terminal domain-containing protein n=1 Tax=uncultured Shewanella sp. TaxID=173975 RepID=UPI00262477F9|nr:type VI secretion protein IcmF/TssM N-terminal domain-containing protein [uncultured Shewanella sp.]